MSVAADRNTIPRLAPGDSPGAEYGSRELRTEESGPLAADVARHREGFLEAMDDDFNTAGAFGSIFELVKAVNVHLTEHKEIDRDGLCEAKALFESTNGVLGYLPEEKKAGGDDAEIDALVAERTEARKARNFKRSDEIRDLLLEKGIVIEDTKEGPRWKRTL